MSHTLHAQYMDFWEKSAQKIVWRNQWTTIHSGELHKSEWFKEGRLNVTETCVDQHAQGSAKEKIAIIWESENGVQRKYAYQQLKIEVEKWASGLRAIGAKKGDRIAIYMPVCPEAVFAMLACARIGAVHTVVFAGFSAQSLKDRIDDCECRFIITADGFLRKGKIIPLKSIVDDALKHSRKKTVEKAVFLKHANNNISINPWDIDAADLLSLAKPSLSYPEIVDAEHPLFILYTSGTTGHPKGLVHTCGGYLTQVKASCETVFQMRDDDIYWCTADIGWITGHSYVVYGPLAMGATLFLYEGALNFPTPHRLYDLIDSHKVTILYTSPTAIRQFMQSGVIPLNTHSLNSLRLLGTVGEPINPEAWYFWHREIGRGRCPIVDTWWQTETGAIMIAPLVDQVTAKPGAAMLPLPGISAEVVDAKGQRVDKGESGYLVIKTSWPSMARGIYGDQTRFFDTYFSRFKNAYFTGDGAKVDEDGHIWILGRVDDVVNISGHRLGTAEVESALITHPAVAESGVVSRPDAITGEAIVAFVCLKDNRVANPALLSELQNTVAKEIGSFARPKEIIFTKSLPKTRSGKIMRRVLRQLASAGEVTGDLSTLEDLDALSHLMQSMQGTNVSTR